MKGRFEGEVKVGVFARLNMIIMIIVIIGSSLEFES